MAAVYDADVIGAGVIGASTALALARNGRRVLCVDKLPAAGYGSTSGSCAIVRPSYSAVDGSSLAYESHFYWKEWDKFLNTADERGLARYVNCGNLVVKCARNKYLEPILRVMREIGCPYREFSAEDVKKRLPFAVMESFDPPRRPEDPEFAHSNGEKLPGAVHFPTGGFVTVPPPAVPQLPGVAEGARAPF